MTNITKKSAPMQIVDTVWEFLKHPVTALVVGILLTIFFYNLSLKDIEPRYAVSEPELIAEQTLDAPDLKLFWGDDEIQDIRSVKIAIWNSGKQYLDNASISDTDPIRILVPKGINVLYSEFIKTSRQELRFITTKEMASDNSQYILIEIKGDEALEYNDGGIVKILYTGQPATVFAVQGRIKGSKAGFIETEWRGTNTLLVVMLIFNAIVVSFSSVQTSKNIFKQLKNNTWKSRSFVLGLFSLLLNLGILIYVVVFMFGNLVSITQPDWID